MIAERRPLDRPVEHLHHLAAHGLSIDTRGAVAEREEISAGVAIRADAAESIEERGDPREPPKRRLQSLDLVDVVDVRKDRGHRGRRRESAPPPRQL